MILGHAVKELRSVLSIIGIICLYLVKQRKWGVIFVFYWLLLVSLGLLLYFVTLGRAWLLHSLNEAALEAFLATLIVDIAFVICQLQFIHLVR